MARNGASLVAQTKNLPAVQGTLVLSMGREDPLDEGMAAHPRILAWKTPWTQEPGGLQSKGSQRGGHDRATDITLLLLRRKIKCTSCC